MTNIFDRKPFPTDVSTSTSTEPGSQPDAIQHHLWHWVSSWLEESIVELDTLIVMAPAELRLQFTGYSAMEHAIETMIHQAWLSKAQHRLLAA